MVFSFVFIYDDNHMIELLPHAYLYIGAHDSPSYQRWFAERFAKVSATHQHFQTLVIDDVLTMKTTLTQKSDGGVYVLSCAKATIEAQNALLKVLEEPAEGWYIVLVAPTLNIFVDTVQSRVRAIDPTVDADDPTLVKGLDFIGLTPAKRLNSKDLFITDREGNSLVTFLRLLEDALVVTKDKKIPARHRALGVAAMLSSRRLAMKHVNQDDRIFEYLALSMPVIEVV